VDSYKVTGWYAKLLRADDTLRRFDECYDATVKAFVANESLRSHLSDDEVEIIYQYVARRLVVVAAFAADSTAAIHDIARESDRLQDVASNINQMIGNLDGFTRKNVINLMLKVLEL